MKHEAPNLFLKKFLTTPLKKYFPVFSCFTFRETMIRAIERDIENSPRLIFDIISRFAFPKNKFHLKFAIRLFVSHKI